MSETTSPDKLVRMANQIGTFFASQSEALAATSTADHIRSFWDPRMRAAIVAHVAAGGDGLTPPVRQAIELLRAEGARL
jgi:formate dehydrogenase subunit delta